VGNKVKVEDMFTKRQRFLPQEEWVMFKDETGQIVPAIVSEELWEKANEVRRRRSQDVKERKGLCNHDNLLTGKLYCPHCRATYYRRGSKDRAGNVNSKWVCSGKIKNGSDSCDSVPLYERELIPVIFDLFRDTGEIAADMVEEYEEMYRSISSNGTLPRMIRKQEEIIASETKQRKKLLKLLADELISEKEFAEMMGECSAAIDGAKAEIASLKEQEKSGMEFREHMAKIRSVLQDAQKGANAGEITKDFIDAFIDKIIVTAEPDGTVRLDICLFTGDSTTRYLEKLKIRSCASADEETQDMVDKTGEGGEHMVFRMGHTVKKMIQAYENTVSTNE
jgi:hypothetical protein